MASQQYIFMWAPIAWALAGYFLTGWRWVFKTGEEGRDCLVLAGVMSVIMAVVWAALLPETPPMARRQAPRSVRPSACWGNPTFLIFIIISFVGRGHDAVLLPGHRPVHAGPGDRAEERSGSHGGGPGHAGNRYAGRLGWMVGQAGYKWTLATGAACWLILYVIYVAPRPRGCLVAGQAFHGLAYVFFIIAGQMFANSVAPKDVQASMQALIFMAQTGVGMFLGTQFAGIVMDKYRVEDRFEWRQLWMVPGAS